MTNQPPSDDNQGITPPHLRDDEPQIFSRVDAYAPTPPNTSTLDTILKDWELQDYDAAVLAHQIQTLVKEAIPEKQPDPHKGNISFGHMRGYNQAIDELTTALKERGLI